VVTGLSEATRSRLSLFTLLRCGTGAVLLLATAVAAVLFVLGAWNPWRLVFLEYRFGNPMLGLLVVPIGALVGSWLALPVRDEARQRGRLGFRVTAFVLAVVGVMGWGVFGDHFTFEVQEVTRSPGGDRAVVIVTDRDNPPNSYVRVWAGSGLATREVGDLGRVCGRTSAGFVTDDRITLDTSYGTWEFALDPVTGAPRQVLGPRCPDGPIPATLGA
jgi:hypothetical protein